MRRPSFEVTRNIKHLAAPAATAGLATAREMDGDIGGHLASVRQYPRDLAEHPLRSRGGRTR
jgi:hypothetical protein